MNVLKQHPSRQSTVFFRTNYQPYEVIDKVNFAIVVKIILYQGLCDTYRPNLYYSCRLKYHQDV